MVKNHNKNILKLVLIPLMSFMVFYPTSIAYAAEAGTLDAGDSTSATTSDSSDTSTSSSTDIDVEQMFSEVLSEYASMKDNYTTLSETYSNIPTSNLSKTYIDYLETLESAKENTGFSEKMKAIQSADISINDASMSSSYSKIKSTVTGELLNKGLDISTAVDKYAKQTQTSNTKSLETIKSSVAAGKKYTKLVDNYKSLLVAEDEDGNEIANPYAEEYTKEVLNSLGITKITEALNSNTDSDGSYLTATEIFEKLNAAAQKKSDDYERETDETGEGKTDLEKAKEQTQKANEKYNSSKSSSSNS